MKLTLKIIVGLLLVLLLCLPAYAQEFWSGNPIAEFLDPNTADVYHDFFVDTVMPVVRSEVSSVGSNNPEGDEGVTIYEPDRCWNGYTLLSSQSGHQPEPNGPIYRAILVDMEGNLVREWDLTGNPKKIFPGGYVFGQAQSPEGQNALTLMDWDGNIVWQLNYNYHHDIQREGNPVGYYAPGMGVMIENGKTLVLSNSNPDPNLTKHICDSQLRDDIFRELDPDGNVIWQWEGWEGFEQMGFDAAAKCAIRNRAMGGQGGGPPGGGAPGAGGQRRGLDWLHVNSLSWVGPNKWYDQGDLRFHPDNVIFDCRNTNMTAIIARHDHPEGQWVSGDIVWRVGPDYSYGNPEYKLGQIIGQHMAHMIPDGLPGAGNILLYDNGSDAGYGAVVPGLDRGTFPNKLSDFSRVVEFDPITLDLVWEYRQQHPTADLDGDGDIKGNERKFYSSRISGAQRLENGNTLICEGGAGRIFEVTTEGDVVWEYISTYTGAADALFPRRGVYRAYRVPGSWLPEGIVN